MLAPIQYAKALEAPTIQTTNPLQAVAQGLKIAQGIRSTREAIKADALAEQAAKTAEQYKVDLNEAMANPTVDKFSQLALKYPQQREAFKQYADNMSEAQLKNELRTVGQVFTALQSGANDVALNIIDKQIDALNNANRPSANLQQLRDNMEADPKLAEGFAGMMLSTLMGPEKFTDTFKGIGEESRAKELRTAVLAKKGIELGLTQAQALKVLSGTSDLPTEAQRAAIELEGAKRANNLTPDQIRAEEKTLRAEYDKEGRAFETSESNFNKILLSAKDKTGAGDYALITSFLKMLDPQSVVRGEEFDAAQNTSGIRGTLQTMFDGWTEGTKLTDAQRKMFVGLSRKYYNYDKARNDKTKKGFQIIIDNYGLNPENVFKERKEEFKQIPTPSADLSKRGYMKYKAKK